MYNLCKIDLITYYALKLCMTTNKAPRHLIELQFFFGHNKVFKYDFMVKANFIMATFWYSSKQFTRDPSGVIFL